MRNLVTRNRIANGGFCLFVAMIVISCMAHGILTMRGQSREYQKTESPVYQPFGGAEQKDTR